MTRGGVSVAASVSAVPVPVAVAVYSRRLASRRDSGSARSRSGTPWQHTAAKEVNKQSRIGLIWLLLGCLDLSGRASLLP